MPDPDGSSPHGTPPQPLEFAALIAIGLGGALGTLARFAVGRVLVPLANGIPLATFVVNTIGSFLLGFLLTRTAGRSPSERLLRPFAAIGFCGGFTTFSTLVLEVDQGLARQRFGIAVAYLGITVATGLLAAAGGAGIGHLRGGAATTGPDIVDPDALDDAPGGR